MQRFLGDPQLVRIVRDEVLVKGGLRGTFGLCQGGVGRVLCMECMHLNFPFSEWIPPHSVDR